MDGGSKIRTPCPYDESSLFSRIFYIWVFPLFTKGYNKTLDLEDLYACVKKDDPLFATEKLEKEWNRELALVKQGKSTKPSLIRALRRSYGLWFFLSIQGIFWGEILIRLPQPLMVGRLVRYLSQPDDSAPDAVSYQTACLCGYGIAVTSMLMVFTRQHSFQHIQRIANNLRSALTILVYKKLMRMSRSSFQDTTDIAKVLNVLANDLQRLDEAGQDFVFIFCAPLMSIYVVVISYMTVGVSCAGGLLVLLFFIPFQTVMGRLFSIFRTQATNITDERVKLMNEIVSAMKLIKVYCWEGPFANLVRQVRKKEINAFKKSYVLKAINAAMSFITTRLMLFATFVIYVLLGNKMQPEPVFIIMSLFNAIRIPVTRNFPNAVGVGAEALVGLRRVSDILCMEEKSNGESHENRDGKEDTRSKGSISLVNYTGKWTKNLENNSLNNLTLEVSPGELVMVIGSVGSGKTCLLWSLLNEIHSVSGSCLVSGSLSYCPQESWCFGGTVRENILLGNPYDPVKYNAVIEACGLQRDLQLFPDGDSTFVGEKGYSLSGGQKARLTLARASYHEADVYLLDDPLSAVDPRVATHIFDKCIKGFLKNKTVILVTHQLQFIKKADKIVVMKDGAIDDYGSFSSLSMSSSFFTSFLERLEEIEQKEQIRKTSYIRAKSLSVVEQTEDEREEKPKQEVDRSESVGRGAIPFKVYWQYFSSGGGPLMVFITLTVALLSQMLSHISDLYLSAWTAREDNEPKESLLSQNYIFDDPYKNVYVYTILSISLFGTTLLRAILVFVLCLRSSIRIHNQVFKRLLRAPLLFFENNPLGRIMNRLTRDIGTVDQSLPNLIIELNLTILSVLGIIGTSIAVNYYLAIPTLVLTAIAFPIRGYYIRTAREVQRLDSVTKSPVYGHISTTFDGLVTVRAFKLEDRFLKEFICKVHDTAATRWLVVVATRLLGLLVDAVSSLFILSIVVLLLEMPKGFISGGDAGVILSSSLLLIGMFQYCVRATVDFETQVVSVERVLEYGKLESEAPLVLKGKKNTRDNDWPSQGKISFKHVFLRYSTEAPLVLKDISFEVKPKEKIGVVGRTGAGKSSLITVLFRLVEPQGVIEIDGVDIKSLGLHQLRSAVSIIPQDPSLFSGTVRRNLDPFSSYDDERMWKVMEEANLRKAIEKISGLDSVLSEGGSNWSVGQRQLLCLARALLKNNKILVLDEATANVDQETDTQIQKTIKERFDDCTVITVAHRLNTVIHMDKVLVMDAGQLVEFDTPFNLLQDRRGLFYEMVKQTGPEFETMLHSMAEEHHLKRLQQEDTLKE